MARRRPRPFSGPRTPSTAQLPLPEHFERLTLAGSGPSSPTNKHRTGKRAARSKTTFPANGGIPDDVPRGTAVIRGVEVKEYGAAISKLRLDAQGFHPAVTSKKPWEFIPMWFKVGTLMDRKPTRDEYIEGTVAMNIGNMTYSKTMVDMLSNNYNYRDCSENRLTLEGATYYRPWIDGFALALAKQGFDAIQKLAIASPHSWVNVTNDMVIYNAVSKKLLTKAGPVFVCVSPEYTYADFHEIANSESPNWAAEEIKNQLLAMETLKLVYDETGGAAVPHWHPTEVQSEPAFGPMRAIWGQEASMKVRSLPDTNDLESRCEYRISPPAMLWSSTLQSFPIRLRSLFETAFARREQTKVLIFQKTDCLDRRALAIILRSCKQVTMLGIYDCPLLHIGDVLCILDLIHEVNQTRKAEGHPLIKGFDFHPKFHVGTPYKHPYACVNGLSWGSWEHETVTQGLFCILLEAVLKSKAMKIDLLFDEDRAFWKFLMKLPTLPQAIPTFLDGLYRYLEHAAAGEGHEAATKYALYDMLKPMRMSLFDNLDRDWQRYFPKMGTDLLFCCSCGHETLQDFFNDLTKRVAPPHERVCSGCRLRRMLDEQYDHAKQQKWKILEGIYRSWDSRAFNLDAPMDSRGAGILNLKTRESTRPPMPPLVEGPDGILTRQNYEMALVRDRKYHFDSLQGLPTLEDLADPVKSISDWASTLILSIKGDLHRTVHMLLAETYPDTQGDVRAFKDLRCDGGYTDHFDELQPPAFFPEAAPNDTHSPAIIKHVKFQKRNQLASMPPGRSVRD